jgi:hypothetical protein
MREELDRSISELRGMLVDMSERADDMLGRAVIALVEGDRVRAEEVIYADRAVDQRHVEVQHGVLTTVALQAPVGRDLRLLTAILHTGLHLERMADYGVSVARGAIRLLEMPREESIVELSGRCRGCSRGRTHRDPGAAHARRGPRTQRRGRGRPCRPPRAAHLRGARRVLRAPTRRVCRGRRR